MSTWSSRFGSWGGRFSPFGRGSSNPQVTDSDFSYITSEDLARVQGSQSNTSRTSTPLSPSGDDDILILKHRRVTYPLHFPTKAIDNGEITIGVLRIAAAKKLEVKDARKVKLFYKGRNLKDDRRLARDEGFRSGVVSEILCVVGEANTIGADGGYVESADSADGAASDGSSDSEGDGAASAQDASAASGKKKRRKNRSKKKKAKSGTSSPLTPGYSSGGAPPKPAEYLPTPGSAQPPRPTSAPPPPAAPLPTDPLGQLDALSEKFQTTLRPSCEEFIKNPPADKAKREFEHKRLTETLLQQILLKLDGVETAGVEGAREKRKALVRECQGWLNKLDEVVKA